MADVFISYARADREFVALLEKKLADCNRESWVDWNDIPPSAEWLDEILTGIEAADNFIFIISPQSVTSPICKKEIEHAASCGKKLVPILYRDTAISSIPDALSRRQFVLFQGNNTFDKSFDVLLQTLDTDFGWKRSHTKFLLRSREWQRHDLDSSFLLRGNELAQAQNWLRDTPALIEQREEQRAVGITDGQPLANPLALDGQDSIRLFIEKSTKAEADFLERERVAATAISTAEGAKAAFDKKVRGLRNTKVLLTGAGLPAALYIVILIEQGCGKSAPWVVVGMSLLSVGIAALYLEAESAYGDGTAAKAIHSVLGRNASVLSACAMLFDSVLLGAILLTSAYCYLSNFGIDFSNVVLEHGWGPKVQPFWIPIAISIASIALISITILILLRVSTRVSRRHSSIISNAVALGVITGMAWGVFSFLERKAKFPPLPVPTNIHLSMNSLGWLYDGTKLAISGGALFVAIPFAASFLALADEQDLIVSSSVPVSTRLFDIRWDVYRSIVVRFLSVPFAAVVCVSLIPDSVRVPIYLYTPAVGATMHMVGPLSIKLGVRAIVSFGAVVILVSAYLRTIKSAQRLFATAAESSWLEKRLTATFLNGKFAYPLLTTLIVQVLLLGWSHGQVDKLFGAYAFGFGVGCTLKGISLVARRYRSSDPQGWTFPLTYHLGKKQIALGMVFVTLTVFLLTIVGLVTRKDMLIGVAFTGAFYVALHGSIVARAFRRRLRAIG